MNGSYYVYHNKGLQLKSDFREQIWQVIKALPKNAHGFAGHKLTRGDIVKLGRLALTVREVCVSGNLQVPLKNSLDNTEVELDFGNRGTMLSRCGRNDGAMLNIGMSSQGNLGALDKEIKNSKTPVPEAKLCRICLGEEGSEEDPFISPCNCSGTMKFIHLGCLREWLANKRTER